MTDSRPVCVKCQLSMRVMLNGVKVRYSHDTAQNGDLYKCPKCKNEIITGFGQPYYNEDRTYNYRRDL